MKGNVCVVAIINRSIPSFLRYEENYSAKESQMSYFPYKRITTFAFLEYHTKIYTNSHFSCQLTKVYQGQLTAHTHSTWYNQFKWDIRMQLATFMEVLNIHKE